jgi:heme/copper-type cytochrome/quinol oxidase subunit 2
MFSFLSFSFSLSLYNFFFFSKSDVPVPYQLTFQDPATEFVEGIIDLHHDVFGYLTFICIFVFYMLGSTVFLFRAHSNQQPPVDIRHHTGIEIIWTILPTIIIIAIAIPSFILIYAMDELVGPQITIKAIGNQWYWDYEYTDLSMRVPIFSASKKLIDISLNDNLFRLHSTSLLSHLNFFKQIDNDWVNFHDELVDDMEDHIMNNWLSLELLVSVYYLKQRNFTFSSFFNDSFMELYNYKMKQTLGGYLPFVNWNMYHILYDLLHTFDVVYDFFMKQTVSYLVDTLKVGNFSSTFLSKFFSFYNPTSLFFFNQPFLYTNVISSKIIPEDMYIYYNIYNEIVLEKFYNTDFDLFEKIFAINTFSKNNWVMNFATENSMFYKYNFLLSIEDVINKKRYVTLKELLTSFSYWAFVKVPFSLKVESRMLDSDIVESSFGKKFRLLSVDRPVIMPVGTQIRFLTTANDVLHSWAVPSFGVKIDACPGRLNQVGIYIKREGIFYGQCSEICGVNHGFMPIEVRAYSSSDFLYWAAKNFPSKKFISWTSL